MENIIYANDFLILFRIFRIKKTATIFIAVFALSISLFAQNSPFPWEREIPLKEAAKSVFLTSTLSPDNSLPNRKCFPRDGKAMTINNLKMRTTRPSILMSWRGCFALTFVNAAKPESVC